MSGNDVSFSLSLALQAAASSFGRTEVLSDVHNLLGLSLLMTAAPHDAAIKHWSLLARDAFLVEAGRCLGLTIRDIHPPEAAVGVDRAAEFRQHFDASYAPLIRRALEHGQTVLAWQGWDGDAEHLWGIITREDSRGVGFAGLPFAVEGLSVDKPRELAITRPPVQLYVVEERMGPRAETDVWNAMLVRHAVASVDPTLGTRFGVLSGGPAFRRWAEVVSPVETAGNLTLTRSLLTGIDCFRKGVSEWADFDSAGRKAAALLADHARALHGAMQDAHDRLVAAARSASSCDVVLLVAAIRRAADLTDQTFAALRVAAPQPEWRR